MANLPKRLNPQKTGFLSKLKFNPKKLIVASFVLALILIISGTILFLQQKNEKNQTALAALCTWTGNNSGDFSDSGNWSGCGGVPQNGDDVTFPGTASNYTLNNDISGLDLNAITVEALNTSAYTLSGNSLNATYGITASSGSNDFIFDTNVSACRLEGAGSVTINATITLTIGCIGINYEYGGNIHGTGTFVKTGGWVTTFTGTQIIDANFVVENGQFYAGSSSNITFNNSVTINGGFIWSLGPISVPNNSINVNNDGGVFQRPGSITAYGINFNGGNTTTYGAWADNQTTITDTDLDLNNTLVDISYFGSIVGDTRTLIETTNGHTITGEFSNLTTGTTQFFPSYDKIVELSIIYNSTNITVTVESVSPGCTWTGNNSGLWSDAGNWSGCGNSIPSLDRSLIFPDSASNKNVMNNDISGLNANKITVDGGGYILSGNPLNIYNSAIFNNTYIDGDFSTEFHFDTDVTACGVSGGGNFFVDSASTVTVGCPSYNSSFSGFIGGDGTFNKIDGGIQTLQDATTGNNLTITVNGSFLQIQGNTTINSIVNNNSGGILFNGSGGTVSLPNNTYYQQGGNINLYPNINNPVTFVDFNLQSGNIGVDTSNSATANHGQAEVTGGNLDLSGGTISMRFFDTYNVGDTFTILKTSGSGTISGEFSNLRSESSLLGEAWSGGMIIGSVRYSAAYTSSEVVITIMNISGTLPDGSSGGSCLGNTVLTSATGVVTSGTSNYSPNSNCKWIISPNNADSVTLNFTTFDTESGNDIVNIYDGLTTDNPLIGSFSGNSIPSSVTADSGAMLIVFTSDSATESSGFNANWTTSLLPGPSISTVNASSGTVDGGTNVTLTGTDFVSGQYQNINSVGDTGLDGIRGMVVDSSGNQYIAGGFSGSLNLGGYTLTSNGSEDIYVAKINPDQTYAWAVSAGGSTVDGFTRRQSLTLNPTDGTLMIAGYFTGSASFGGDTLTGGSGANVFISKLNQSDGSFIWTRQGGGNTTQIYNTSIFPVQYGSSIDVDASGNIYFSGTVKGSNIEFGSISLTSPNLIDDLVPFIAKLDSNGNYQWANIYADDESAGYAHGLKVDSSNNVYALISFWGSLTIGADTLTTYCPSNCANSALVKLDTNGNPIWAINSGTSADPVVYSDLPYDVGLDSNEDVYITGYIGGVAGKFGAIELAGSATGSSVFTAKVNPSGAFQWAKLLPGPGFATARTMYIDSNDKIWIAGGYDDVLTDGTSTISGNSTNAFFAEYDTTGNLVQLQGIGGTGGQLAVTGVGGNQVRALAVYNNNLYIAGEYFNTIGIGGQTISSAGNQDGFYTTWVINKTSVKIDGLEVIANYISPTELEFITPPNTKGFKDVIVTNSDGKSFTLTDGYEYIATEILNNDISSMTCTPSPTAVNTTVNCTITTNVDINTLSGSVNVRIGLSGTPTNCPVGASGTTITCNNVAVGGTPGTFPSQYSASGSGGSYVNGNNIVVTASSNPAIQNSDISSLACTPTTTDINTTVNCTITTSVDISTLSGSVNVRIGTGGTPVSCPVTGSGTTLACNNVGVGATVGTFRSQYNASGSGTTYADGNNIAVTSNSGNNGNCGAGAGGSVTPGQTVVDLCVDGGTLTLFAGDSNKNNDICTTADITAGNIVDTTISGQSATSVTCTTAENSIALTGVTVASKRQFATATIDDIIFEDLRGLVTSNYTVTATISNFVDPNDSNKRIDLGSNPDSIDNENDPDKPQASNDSNKIFGVLDASVSTITPLRSATTIAFGVDNYIKGSRTTLVDNVTQVTLLSTSAPTKPGRIVLDNVLFKLRIPSLVTAGNFNGTIVQTVI